MTSEHVCAQCAGYDGCGFCLFHAVLVDPGDDPCEDFEEDDRMAWPKPSTGFCALCGRKTAMILWGAKYGMRICVRCQKVSSAFAKLMILASVTPGNHNFDTDDTIMALAMDDLIPKDAVIDKVGP